MTHGSRFVWRLANFVKLGEPSAGIVRVELLCGCGAVRISTSSGEPSRGFDGLAALALGASLEFCSQSTTFSWFSAMNALACGTSWLILLSWCSAVNGSERRWRVERPQNSGRAMDDLLVDSCASNRSRVVPCEF